MSDITNTYTYNQFNQLASVNGTAIIYDAFGQMVQNGTTSIWYTPAGKSAAINGSSLAYTRIPTPGEGFDSHFGGADQFLHSDWLGNARIVSNVAASSATMDTAFAPYGQQYDTFGTTGSGYDSFTGDYSLVIPGSFWDTPNRELTNVGRWLNPDPAGAGWNQYAYVTNPNSQLDPSGLDCLVNCDDPVGPWGGGGLFFPGAPGFIPSNYAYGPNAYHAVPGSGFGFSFDASGFDGGCDSDFMPCGLPMPGLAQALGLPSLSCPQWMGPQCGGINPAMDAGPANTATISAYHPSVGTCLGQAAISAGEDLLGLSMLPGSDQDNWQWQSAGWNSGFVYTGAGEVMDSSVGLDAVENAADFVADNPAAQGTIRQFLRSQGVNWSMKHVANDAAWAGKWAGRIGKVLAAYSAYQRYQKCQGN